MKRKKPTEEELLRSINKPGDLRPDQFEPRILSLRRNELLKFPEDWNQQGPEESKWPEHDVTWVQILVCWKRMVRGKKLDETHPIPDCLPKDGSVSEVTETNQLASSPVSILLSHPVKVLYGLHLHTPLDHCKWIVSRVEAFGLGKREAGAALAAAWRGVEKVAPSWPDSGGIKLGFRTPWMCLENDRFDPNGTGLRRFSSESELVTS
jgi:hypothetical protein